MTNGSEAVPHASLNIMYFGSLLSMCHSIVLPCSIGNSFVTGLKFVVVLWPALLREIVRKHLILYRTLKFLFSKPHLLKPVNDLIPPSFLSGERKIIDHKLQGLVSLVGIDIKPVGCLHPVSVRWLKCGAIEGDGFDAAALGLA